MTVFIEDLEAAMKNADIDDDALLRMFRSFKDPVELVWCAVETNNERAVRLLVAEQFDFYLLLDKRSSLLHYAYEKASLRIVDVLLAAGLSGEALDQFGLPPWQFAAYNKDESVMAYLIATGVDVNAVDARGVSLAHRAARNENEKVLAMLIAAGADVSVRDIDGNSLCHTAAGNPNPAVLALLIPHCDVNAVSNDGITPCIVAASKQNSIALELLIGAGANVHIGANDGVTALSVALSVMDEKSVELLIDASADVNTVDRCYGMTAMHLAAMWCNNRLLGKLIAAGATVNALDENQRTPCHMFWKTKDPRGDGAARSMAMLIAAGADVNARDDDNETPLHCAARVGFSDCMALLLQAGANVEARNQWSQSPLHLAKNSSAAAMLVGAKADVNAVDIYGKTACHTAVGRPLVLSFLVSAGANVHARNQYGQTALHVAADMENSIDAMSVLIDAGVDVNQGDNNGDCAGHWAADNGLVDNLKFLIEHGAQMERRNNAGKTMLYVAASARSHAGQLMRLLIEAGADMSVIDDDTVAYGASAAAFPLLRSLGVNFNHVDDDGNTPCHAARDSAALAALFGLGATMTAKNNAGATPYETFLAKEVSAERDRALLTFVAAGLGFGVQTNLERVVEIGAIAVAGGGFVSAQADAAALLECIEKRQQWLFRARALEVCIGLQSLRVSALEMCEILANMFAPLESIVPFAFAWRVVTKVKHFKR